MQRAGKRPSAIKVAPPAGTKRRSHLQDNLAATDLALSGDELARLDALRPSDSRVIADAEINRTTVAAH